MTTHNEFAELPYDYGCKRASGDRGYESDRILAAAKEDALLAVFDAQAARIAELEAALSPLVAVVGDGDEPGIYDHYFCVYGCDPVADGNDAIHHGPECPISQARKALDEEYDKSK